MYLCVCVSMCVCVCASVCVYVRVYVCECMRRGRGGLSEFGLNQVEIL